MNSNDAVPPQLFFGPYAPPKVEPGARLLCELRGTVLVRDFTNGPIPWPRARVENGLPPIIVCGDLARAIRSESMSAVAYWWGVSPTRASDWRKALGVGHMNDGTRLAAEAARRRRSNATGPSRRRWSEAELALLGNMTDQEVADRLDISVGRVFLRRCKLGIPAFRDRRFGPGEPKVVPVSKAWLAARRRQLGLRQRQVARRAGISIAYVSLLEMGRRVRLSRPAAERLAGVLKCTVTDLAGASSERRPK